MNKPEQKTTDEIENEALYFETQLDFRNPNAPLFNIEKPYNFKSISIKHNLTPAQVFQKLSFSQIEYENLDPKLKQGLEKDRNFFGHPLTKIGKINPNTKCLINKKGDVIYTVNGKDKGIYSWSRINKTDKGYEVQEIGDNSEMFNIISGFAFYEIKNSQNSMAFPRLPENDKAPRMIEGVDIVEKTRKDIGESTGLA